MTERSLKISRVGWAIAATGIGFRLVVYLYARCLWLDEAAIALNIIRRDYGSLLERLDYTQVCPPLFLLISKLTYECWGSLEYSFRFLPLLAGCLTLLLLRKLVLETSPNLAGLLALSLYAFGVQHVDWATTFKQYATDQLCVASVLFTAWYWDEISPAKRYWAAAVLPAIIWLSYVSSFALVGLVLVAGASLFRSRDRSTAGALITLLVSVFLSASSLYLASARYSIGHSKMVSVWRDGFTGSEPALWLIGRVFDLFGTGAGIPIAPALFAAISVLGVCQVVRSGRTPIAILAGGTLVSAVAACLLRVYPMTGGRLSAYWGPIVIVLLANGFEAAREATANTWLAKFVRGSVFALFVVMAVGHFYWAPLLFSRQELRGIAEEVRDRYDDHIPIVATSQSFPPFVLYGGEAVESRTTATDGRISPCELERAWVKAGKPSRFWIITSLWDEDTAEDAWAEIAPSVTVIDKIEAGSSAATLVEVRR